MQHPSNRIFKDYKKLSQLVNNGTVFVAFDTETTGLRAVSDRIIELGAVKFDTNGEIERFSALINPEIHITSAATAVNNIDDSMVKNCPPIKDILPRFINFIGKDTILIAHNAQFDLNFLNEELKRNNFSCINNIAIDTLQLSRWAFPAFERHKLQYLAEQLNIDVQNAHRAEDDALVCMHLFLKIVKNNSIPEVAFKKLYDIIKTLRSENGCPWDKNQTPISIRHNLVEETFEAVDAISNNDLPHIREELGDIILNALMLSYMYEQNDDFTIEQVLNDVCNKLIRRHPHVFTESIGRSEMKNIPINSNQVLSQWDKIKENVEGRKSDYTLDDIPNSFPPLLKAQKMLQKAAKKGFEWQDFSEVKSKVTEEWSEVEEARKAVEKISQGKTPFTVSDENKEINEKQLQLEEEVGDLILAIVNYSRWIGVDPSIALNIANRKFKNRFDFVEKSMKECNIDMNSNSIQDMLRFWDDAKSKGNLLLKNNRSFE